MRLAAFEASKRMGNCLSSWSVPGAKGSESLDSGPIRKPQGTAHDISLHWESVALASCLRDTHVAEAEPVALGV